MSSTEHLTRDKERTRRALLDAAQQLFTEQGTKASLADIAAIAGVTKGGLLHHFPHREALLVAVLEHQIAQVWDEVRACIDLSENRAGKFTRGFVRALTGDSQPLMAAYSPTGLVAVLGTLSEFAEICERDAARWDTAFAQDGLEPGRTLAVRYAAEGLATAVGTPYLSSEQLAVARVELLSLAEPA